MTRLQNKTVTQAESIVNDLEEAIAEVCRKHGISGSAGDYSLYDAVRREVERARGPRRILDVDVETDELYWRCERGCDSCEGQL
jgi:hypothetical protein